MKNLMETYKIDMSKKWDYENGFYLSCETGRIAKLISHLEIYKKIVDIPGDILEFGVYKGTSFVRLISFRDILETQDSRKVVGFDMFGKFPDENLSVESDKDFVEKFEGAGGYGLDGTYFNNLLRVEKKVTNFELVGGDICETIDTYLKTYPELRIAMIHIDVDVYEPTKVILEKLWGRVVKGGILMLDDYGTVEGETMAVDEFFGDDVEIKKIPYYHTPSYIVK